MMVKNIGIVLFVTGIAGNIILLRLQYEGIIHDLTRFCALIGIIMLIIGVVKGRKEKPKKR
jgi:hypothetical protein